MIDIVIVASAFGADAVRRAGHRAFVAAAADAGAAGFEVRRELFASDDDAATPALGQLGDALAAAGLWSVYSTPATLYADDGGLNRDALAATLAEADALDARFVKFQLGGFAAHAHAAEIAAATRGARARVLVENGQMRQGGALAQFTSLFAALRDEAFPALVGMTFDIGNWLWAGEAPLAAARALADHVEYIHCKAVDGEGARRFSIAPPPRDRFCDDALALLPRTVPRGIEFPFDAARVADDATTRVAWLKAA
ncbi:TIM barrel protein [Burkholderia oklahomensis]|uniref:TIM barrel protein n=1 Tax=Burkholderia oklahomensis TaxID=342113 RepID=UPI00016A74B5|nr:TIM barrel protein [Burkholderia oklahomensis]AJX32467.1 xylose isomerase-like TIM barrel family protein [Burkholderia oklahomensis C6786]AOI45899.1 xylose isomerase [Burkholderia oklahomensis C6786]KUY52878.1 xylose isomerase [Burkholderia oklahomensis C6786]MBI0361559.1 TIM barrel protein [Burkholderia oklahomensis]SUW55642.1 Xylose isomerase-like TIM barrel [Burkholderia oklahomensis]